MGEWEHGRSCFRKHGGMGGTETRRTFAKLRFSVSPSLRVKRRRPLRLLRAYGIDKKLTNFAIIDYSSVAMKGTKTILYEVLSAYMGSALYCMICFLLRLAMSSAADFEEDSFKVLCLVFLHFILIAPIHSIGLHVYFHPPRKVFQAKLLLLPLLSILVFAFAIWPTVMLFYSIYAFPALVASLLICRYFQKRRNLQ